MQKGRRFYEENLILIEIISNSKTFNRTELLTQPSRPRNEDDERSCVFSAQQHMMILWLSFRKVYIKKVQSSIKSVIEWKVFDFLFSSYLQPSGLHFHTIYNMFAIL